MVLLELVRFTCYNRIIRALENLFLRTSVRMSVLLIRQRAKNWDFERISERHRLICISCLRLVRHWSGPRKVLLVSQWRKSLRTSPFALFYHTVTVHQQSGCWQCDESKYIWYFECVKYSKCLSIPNLHIINANKNCFFSEYKSYAWFQED